MNSKYTLCLVLLLMVGCNSRNDTSASNGIIATKFIDAFYSFSGDSLQAILSDAGKSKSDMLYYQKWAECGHYEVISRGQYIVKNDSIIIFPVTVKDDLMAALQIDLNVTDTFRISIQNGKIRSVKTSSNDPDEAREAVEWVKQNRPELIEKVCDGPTACECIKGIVKGFAAFADREKQTPQ